MTDLLEEREAIVKKFPAVPVEVEQQTRCPPAIPDATANAMADSKARMDKSRVDEDGPGRTTKRVLSVTKNTEGDFSTIDNYSKGGRHSFQLSAKNLCISGTMQDQAILYSPGRLCYNPGNEGLSLQSKTTIGGLVRVTGDNVIDIKEPVTSMGSLEANHTSQERSRGTDGYRRRHPEFPVQTDNPKNDNKSSRLQIFQIEEAIAEHNSDQVLVATPEALPITAIAGESVVVKDLASLFNVNKALSTGDSAQLVGAITEERLRSLVEKRY